MGRSRDGTSIPCMSLAVKEAAYSASFLFEVLHRSEAGCTCSLREIDSVRKADDTLRKAAARLLTSFWKWSHLAFTLVVRLIQWNADRALLAFYLAPVWHDSGLGKP